LASERRDESLELGMADTLIMKLGSNENVTVLPLSSVRRFTALDQDPIAAGRMVNVDAVLDGSIQTADERIRVTVKLLRVADSRQIWSEKFDEKLTDIFAVQDSIARRVAEALNIRLGRAAQHSLTENVEAYQLYMRGKFHTRRLIRAEVEKGIGFYEEALKLDPKFAQVYVDMANAYRALVLTGDSRPSEMMPKAKAAANKALELDDKLAEAWSAQAISDFWYDWDWRASETKYLRAIELDPYNSLSRLFYAHLLSNLGRHDEALEQIRKARERDPISLVVNAVEGQVLFFAGRTDASAAALKRTIDMDPNFWLAHLFITRVHLRNGDYDEVIRSGERAAELTGGNAEALATVAFGYARSGRPDEARRILAELQERSKTRYVPSCALAQIYAGLGDRDAAFAQLEKAYTERDAIMVFLKVEPKWDDLRTDPRFVDLLRRMRFE
jgi:serine/threonine-protein kinase